jgi:hypothetical protein
MTLILNCITRDYAIQVSDRRLTVGKGKQVTNEANKVVLWGGRMSLAYTGIAELGAKRDFPAWPDGVARSPLLAHTDIWMTEILSGTRNLKEATDILEQAAAREVTKFPEQYCRQAFAGILWGAWRAAPDTLLPAVVVVSNYINSRGQIRELPGTFATDVTLLDPKELVYILPIGQVPSESYMADVNRKVRRAVAKKVAPHEVATLLAQAVIGKSGSGSTVGDSLMVVILPKAAIPISEIVAPYPYPAGRDDPIFAYLPSKDAPKGAYFLPNVAGQDVSFAHMMIGPTRPD